MNKHKLKLQNAYSIIHLVEKSKNSKKNIYKYMLIMGFNISILNLLLSLLFRYFDSL